MDLSRPKYIHKKIDRDLVYLREYIDKDGVTKYETICQWVCYFPGDEQYKTDIENMKSEIDQLKLEMFGLEQMIRYGCADGKEMCRKINH